MLDTNHGMFFMDESQSKQRVQLSKSKGLPVVSRLSKQQGASKQNQASLKAAITRVKVSEINNSRCVNNPRQCRNHTSNKLNRQKVSQQMERVVDANPVDVFQSMVSQDLLVREEDFDNQ